MEKVCKLGVNQRKRLLAIFVVFFMTSSLLTVRTGFIQIFQGEWLRRRAIEQQTRDRIISSKRGAIFDRNGETLAVSSTVETVSASPAQIRESGKAGLISDKLAEILNLDRDDIYKKITKNSYYEVIKRKIEATQAEQIREFLRQDRSIRGITLDEDSKRCYPYGAFASHVIGFAGSDNQGLNGLEMVFDRYLKGVPGRIITAKNAANLEMSYKYEKYIDPENGVGLVLTIDEAIQHYTEKHLETAYIENKLREGAAAIVLDIKTGEILAMSTKPDYDLNCPFELVNSSVKQSLKNLDEQQYTKRLNEELQKQWRNKAVVDSYEPGSTFKIATTAIALEERAVNLDDRFYCKGSTNVAKRNIRCAKTVGHGAESFLEGVKNSCNPVFVEVGARLGADTFYKYIKGLGFRDKTGIELPGETSGIFFERKNFNELELATTSFGQGFQVTPLQLITIASAIANDGNMMKPHLVKKLVDQDMNVVKSFEPEFARQIISRETSDMVCDILEKVVSEGTGRNAYIPGYRVGGKTGTSEKQPRGSGKYIASFLGFAPADDPQIACLVMLDEPQGYLYYGGTIAAPVAKYIMEDTLRHLDIQPEYTKEELEKIGVVVPQLIALKKDEAKKILKDANINFKIEGSGDKITDQVPKEMSKMNAGSVVTLYTEGAAVRKTAVVPKVIGKSVSEANRLITNAGLNVRIKGFSKADGSVQCAYQSIPAGDIVEPSTVVTLEFRYIIVE